MLQRWGTAVVGFVLLLGMVSGWTGCGGASNGEMLVVAVESQPRSLDPRLGSGDGVSARIHQIVFDSLVRKNERFEYVPHLAESFERSADAKVYTFRLRPGVKFHNGQDLTSNDVKHTYESTLSPDLKSPVAAAFARIERIETPDPLTAVFYCREPYYQLLGDVMAIPVIAQVAGAPVTAQPIGTGPFKIVDSSEQIVDLEAHEDYFLGPPAIKQVRIRVVKDNNTRELELKSGYVDIAINSDFSPDTVTSMKQDPELQVVVGPGTNIAHIGLNTTDEVLRNVRVRQALAYALNRDQIIETLLQGLARPADAIMPPESWAYEPGIKTYPYDIARAKQLLDEAGYPDPDGDGPQVRFTIEFATSSSGNAPAIAQIVQEQWKLAGVGVNATQMERSTFFDRVNSGNSDCYYLVSVGGNQTPDVFGWAYYPRYWAADASELDALVAKIRSASSAADVAAEMAKVLEIAARKEYCPSAEVDALVAEARTASAEPRRQAVLGIYDLLMSRGAGNRPRYCNPALDELILKGERSASREEQRAIFGEIQKTIAEEVPHIYLWYQANVIVARKRVGNIQIEPSGAWYFLENLTLAGVGE